MNLRIAATPVGTVAPSPRERETRGAVVTNGSSLVERERVEVNKTKVFRDALNNIDLSSQNNLKDQLGNYPLTKE